jgi:hypothetical protein
MTFGKYRASLPEQDGIVLLNITVHYSIFTSGVYKATAPDAAFPQEKTLFAETTCAEKK